jgi:hypothetical protein
MQAFDSDDSLCCFNFVLLPDGVLEGPGRLIALAMEDKQILGIRAGPVSGGDDFDQRFGVMTLGGQAIGSTGNAAVVGVGSRYVVHLTMKFRDFLDWNLCKKGETVCHLYCHLLRGGVFWKRAEKPSQTDNVGDVFFPRMTDKDSGVFLKFADDFREFSDVGKRNRRPDPENQTVAMLLDTLTEELGVEVEFLKKVIVRESKISNLAAMVVVDDEVVVEVGVHGVKDFTGAESHGLWVLGILKQKFQFDNTLFGMI